MPEKKTIQHLNGHTLHSSLTEVRSEEVQEIMGKMPPWMVRSGITMIGIAMVLALTGAWFFRYPDVLPMPVRVTPQERSFIVQGHIPAADAWRIKAGQQVMLRLTAYPSDTYGLLPGTVTSDAVAETDSSFRVEVKLTQGMLSTSGKQIPVQPVLTGTAEIMTDDKSLLQRILGKALAPLMTE
ncbi:HlyD family efflux transporter periplasmic adaptor subunit [Chitinophaga oryzae]|uniref:HlyD family efflux transporter periplasmic adaptor subunit n=1 Tax=Chitinophaga oryzae TaxID=2725414 RepID=A0AAE7D8T7_9BACT|nr:HlyD family secretion protein [Chitinophaga oryzae]QJB32478.1 HlyD family efflux transporter periplasmic adaptor subunit [Chitinophaga oryzae]QJB38951.1 HlyD family efflux transporter periplasmic adaptor subunit [Chitinophaga oryzae]